MILERILKSFFEMRVGLFPRDQGMNLADALGKQDSVASHEELRTDEKRLEDSLHRGDKEMTRLPITSLFATCAQSFMSFPPIKHLTNLPYHCLHMHFMTSPAHNPTGSPVVDVVVFPSPSPVLVGEAVDFEKLLFAEAGDSTKIARIWQPVGNGNRKEKKKVY